MADTVTRALTGTGRFGSGLKLPVYKSGKPVQTALIREGSLSPEAYGFWNAGIAVLTLVCESLHSSPRSQLQQHQLVGKGGWTPVPFDLPPGSLPPPQEGQMLLLTLKGEGRGGK